ncbi:hypothetical protein KIN20_004812 [Parelaphostrongylus tenuis]|uniref:Uncharacterized protein n=1 Tax=Parelaphostrongylus tenuis TaxID=148309 RepID=A0AAD5QFH4_PARTN|nr:hypothetical protein KIN20_004812 [Parelaphostrongylus tenuis]
MIHFSNVCFGLVQQTNFPVFISDFAFCFTHFELCSSRIELFIPSIPVYKQCHHYLMTFLFKLHSLYCFQNGSKILLQQVWDPPKILIKQHFLLFEFLLLREFPSPRRALEYSCRLNQSYGYNSSLHMMKFVELFS